jgi:hypothetical protein
MPTAGPSGTQASTPISTSRYAVDAPDIDDSEVEGDVEMASGDESFDGGDDVPSGIDSADASSVDRMLERSVKPGTLKKYSRQWDKWALFALAYDIEIMPPDMRGLEIYIADLAELSGSANVANLAAASIAHF